MFEIVYFHATMNFLAHAYLAGSDPGMIVGNLLADSVNKTQYEQLPLHVRAGVDHHRQIDVFTDTHPLVRTCRKMFFPHIRHYAAVIVDVVFDHYLAKNWKEYHPQPLHDFEMSVYLVLDKHAQYFSKKYAFMYSRMKTHRWLYNYQFENYIEKTIRNLNYRSPQFNGAEITIQVFREHYMILEDYFTDFFDALCRACKQS